MTSKTIALRQFDGTANLMKINLSPLAHEIVPAQETGEEKIAFAMFETEASNHLPESLAMLATPEGPF
ncbi:hypothetical protein [Duganella sp. Root198D2]|uniref:hypothetical protein n=1 Tax=Duganella sp. Root198D2 TaxID=1736489 RepID=UPI00070F71AE|nr:hypothetical protein [Duganella sp. Root198D2]KRB86956.1 hypothetical protein ASE26_29475 [Duganella sp. Root198D2]